MLLVIDKNTIVRYKHIHIHLQTYMHTFLYLYPLYIHQIYEGAHILSKNFSIYY